MKTLKLIYLDEWQGELDHPYVNSPELFVAMLDDMDVCYTSNLALYDFFRLSIKRGVLDHETSCVEYRGKVFRFNPRGKSENHPEFHDFHVGVIGELACFTTLEKEKSRGG